MTFYVKDYEEKKKRKKKSKWHILSENFTNFLTGSESNPEDNTFDPIPSKRVQNKGSGRDGEEEVCDRPEGGIAGS